MSVFIEPALRINYPQAYAGVRAYFVRQQQRVVEQLGPGVRSHVRVLADAWDRKRLRRLIVFCSRCQLLVYAPEGKALLPPSPGEHIWRDAGAGFFRLDYRPDPPSVGDHRLPTATEVGGWQPKSWVRLREVPKLPPALQRSPLTQHWQEELKNRFGAKAQKRLQDHGSLCLFDAWELLDYDASVQAIIAGWPLKYVRRSYLEWLVFDGRFQRRFRVNQAWRTPHGWAHQEAASPGTAGGRRGGWWLLMDDQMPSASPEQSGNVLREAILRYLATQVRQVHDPESGSSRLLYYDEPLYDDDPELINREGFCTWGYWDKEDRFHESGTSRPVLWTTHEIPLWLNSTNRFRWTLPENDLSTWSGARLGLVENGGNGRLTLRDGWTPSQAEEPGRTEVRLPPLLKQAWLAGQLQDIPSPFLVRVDYEEPRVPRGPEEAFRQAFEQADRLERLLALLRRGENVKLDADEREEQLHQVLGLFLDYHRRLAALLEDFYPEAAAALDIPGRCEEAWALLGHTDTATSSVAEDETPPLNLEFLAWRALDELEKFLQRHQQQVWAYEAVSQTARDETFRVKFTDAGPATREEVAKALSEALAKSHRKTAFVEALEVALGQYDNEGRQGLAVYDRVACVV